MLNLKVRKDEESTMKKAKSAKVRATAEKIKAAKKAVRDSKIKTKGGKKGAANHLSQLVAMDVVQLYHLHKKRTSILTMSWLMMKTTTMMMKTASKRHHEIHSEVSAYAGPLFIWLYPVYNNILQLGSISLLLHKYFFIGIFVNKTTFEENYKKLNPEQQEAVNTLEGPVMVIAGPGTGKTQIIGMRTANIILKSGVNPENIMITTFTEAGVIAIRERLISMIGSEAYKVYVSTVHSFAQDVIKTFPEKFTTEKLDTPIDDIESMELISEIVSDLLKYQKLEYLTTFGDPLFYVRTIKSAINDLKREGITLSKLQKSIEKETERSLAWLEEKRNNKRIKKIEKYEEEHEKHIGKLRELHSIFEIYNTKLRERGFYDFNDMINFVLEKFRTDEDMKSFYAETYQYIMLDEYQDTNNPQNEIVNMILSFSELPNIMVVGDDDQSIYRFQGANIENMLDFTSNYKDVKIIVLDKNYRSYQSILDISHSLIEHNNQRLISKIPALEKNLFSQVKSQDQNPSLYLAKSEIDERIYIKNNLIKLQDSGVAAHEIAVIVRSNAEVTFYGEFLKEYGIEVQSKRDSNILDNDSIAMILSFFQILIDPYAAESQFLNLLRSNLIDIDNMDILKINTYLYRENYSRRGNKLKIFDVIRDGAALQIIGVQDSHKIHLFVETYMDVQQQFAQSNFILALSYFLKSFGILTYIENNGSFFDIQDIYTLFHTCKSWAAFQKNICLQSVLDKIALHEKYNYSISRLAQENNTTGVHILTAHSSKGLEFEHVFIPGLYTGNWDQKSTRTLIKLPEGIVGDGLQFAQLEMMSEVERKSHEKEIQNEEDRRLFFVALTRAKRGLALSFPESIDGKAKIISPFVTELGNLNHITSEIRPEESIADMTRDMLQESKFIKYSYKEIDYISEYLRNYKLSVSDLNTFLLNPKDFLYRTILKYPFEENENSIFGTMYHRTLELFYKKILESGEVQNYEYMEYVFLRQLEREYLSFEERERLTRRGLESLRGYYETYQGTFVAPLKTEYKFSRKNIFFEGIPLTGIIDKIELLDSSYNEDFSHGTLFSQAIKITDYKTGAAKYMGDIKGIDREGKKDEGYERGKYGRQLLFYKLLFENDSELYSQFQLSCLELDFCEGKKGSYKRVEVEFSEEEFQEFKELVKKTYQQMIDMSFWREYLGLDS